MFSNLSDSGSLFSMDMKPGKCMTLVCEVEDFICLFWFLLATSGSSQGLILGLVFGGLNRVLTSFPNLKKYIRGNILRDNTINC